MFSSAISARRSCSAKKRLAPHFSKRGAADQRVGEGSRPVGLARARRAVEDEVLLVKQEAEVAGPLLAIGVGLPDSVQRRVVEVDRAAVEVRLDSEVLQRAADSEQLFVEILGRIGPVEELAAQGLDDLLLVSAAGNPLELLGAQQVEQDVAHLAYRRRLRWRRRRTRAAPKHPPAWLAAPQHVSAFQRIAKSKR